MIIGSVIAPTKFAKCVLFICLVVLLIAFLTGGFDGYIEGFKKNPIKNIDSDYDWIRNSREIYDK